MSKPLGIPVCTDGFAAAHAMALEAGEPRFVPVPHYTDDRGWSLMNMMTDVLRPEGQINFSTQYPGAIKAWHRHQKQTDFWCVLTGHLVVGVVRDDDGVCWKLIAGEKRPGVVIIPPPLWHGATVAGPEPAGLLYYVTHAYDPAHPDEERKAYDGFPQFSWALVHG
jgi:dTDP-4-dehydrorhamnose 3,5-epimerase